jgi:hypothetical protein
LLSPPFSKIEKEISKVELYQLPFIHYQIINIMTNSFSKYLEVAKQFKYKPKAYDNHT